jgi:hypothetical protein
MIRKLKKTMRRKMQRGGNLGLVAPVFLLFAALFANNPTVTKVLSVAELIIGGGDKQTGGNKRLNQMGGGEQFNRALDGLRDTITQDNISNLSDEERTNLISCIDTLKSNGGISDADIQRMGGQTGGAFGLSIPSSLTGAFNNLREQGYAAASAAASGLEAKAAATKAAASDVASGLEANAAAVKAAAARGMNDLKDTATKTFMENFRTQFDNVKSVIIAKVSNMKDKGKQDCMTLILSYGIRLIKAKLSSVTMENSMENIKKAMALNANAAANLVRKFTGSSSPSSTQATGDDSVHIIEIKKSGLTGPDIDKQSSDNNFKLFEDKLRAKLRENDWPADEAEFNVGISSYNNAKIKSDPNLSTSTSGVSDILFIFALYSGMITSIEFTDEKKNPISLSGPAAFFEKYTRGNPYFMFKSHLYDILSNTSRFTRSIQVKITTDFSKIPDYLPVKKDVLKSANRQTVEYYRSVKKQKADSLLAVETAKKERNDYARGRAQEALKSAAKTADDAFLRADTAFKAALDAGIQPSELIPIQS